MRINAPVLLSFLLLGALSGCLRMGLPEPFLSVAAPESLREPTLRPVILLRPPAKDVYGPGGLARSGSLGTQFLFPFFPVTRLYLEHGLPSAAVELSLEELTSRRLPVVIAPQSVRRLGVCGVSLTPRLDASVTVYDLLFTRMISLRVDATLGEPASGGTAHPSRDSARSFRSFAQADVLSRELTLAAREEFRGQLARAATEWERCRGRTAEALTTAEGPSAAYVIRLPVGLASPDSPEHVAKSYGFPARPGWTPSGLMRLVQRGIARGIEGAGSIPLELTEPAGPGPIRTRVSFEGERIFDVNVVSQGLVVKPDGAKLSATVDVVPVTADLERRRDRALLRLVCEVEAPVRTDVDGAGAVAVEDAGEHLATSIVTLAEQRGAHGATVPGEPCRLSR